MRVITINLPESMLNQIDQIYEKMEELHSILIRNVILTMFKNKPPLFKDKYVKNLLLGKSLSLYQEDIIINYGTYKDKLRVDCYLSQNHSLLQRLYEKFTIILENSYKIYLCKFFQILK
jgi:hypothetical protein